MIRTTSIGDHIKVLEDRAMLWTFSPLKHRYCLFSRSVFHFPQKGQIFVPFQETLCDARIVSLCRILSFCCFCSSIRNRWKQNALRQSRVLGLIPRSAQTNAFPLYVSNERSKWKPNMGNNAAETRSRRFPPEELPRPVKKCSRCRDRSEVGCVAWPAAIHPISSASKRVALIFYQSVISLRAK